MSTRTRGKSTRLAVAAIAAFSIIVLLYQRQLLTVNDLLAHGTNSSPIILTDTDIGNTATSTTIDSNLAQSSPTTAISTVKPTIEEHGNEHHGLSVEMPIIEEDTYVQMRVWSRIGKVSMLYYDEITSISRAYERALLSHIEHDQRFRYSHYVVRRDVVEGSWTKQAIILHQLVQELAKPQGERLDWLFWHDADMVIVNSKMPLEAFLPPEPDWSHINFVVSNDLGGLNDGVFFIRVCGWSVRFFAAGLSYPIYNPGVPLREKGQTASDFLIQEERWANHTMHVPQRWFNAYHHFGRDDDIPPEWNWTQGYQEPGDLLVHFPGTADFRSQLIDEWLHKIEFERETYCKPFSDTSYPDDIPKFWEKDAANEAETQRTFWRRLKLIHEVGGQEDDKVRKEVEEVEARMQGSATDEEIEKAVEQTKERGKQKKIEALRAADAKAS